MKQFARLFISNQKVIGGLLVNLAGVQIARIIVFNLALIALRMKNSIKLRNDLYQLKKEGFVVLTEYFPASEFESLRKVFYEIMESPNFKKKKYFKNEDFIDITGVNLSKESVSEYPILVNLFNSPHIINAFRYLCGKNIELSEINLELVRHREGEIDPCNAMHTDTFFPNQNAWFFVENCDLNSGPFVYAPRSHRVTFRRLIFQYVASVERYFGARGSARVSPPFERFLGLHAEPVVVPRNTLVISNNFGFHARGSGCNGMTRAGYKLSMKETPFSKSGAAG